MQNNELNDGALLRKAVLYGIAGSFFFAFNFVLLRSMNLGGGYWLYSGVLRYLFTLPLMLPFVLRGGRLAPVLASIRQKPMGWLIWSTVGFGLFYLPLTAATVYAEGWFTCATWQITIVCGMLLTPLFGRPVPLRNLCFAGLILLGVGIMQIPKLDTLGGEGILTALALIIVGAFSYPLGNRKMIEICAGELDTQQRVFGMTLLSLPFWLIAGAVAWLQVGAPGVGQLEQSFLVALFAGVIATILFFHATDMVRGNLRHIAAVEVTQSGEVIFTLLLGYLLLGDALPEPLSFAGIGLIVLGMTLNSLG